MSRWFGVKTFYRTRIVGRPSGRDQDYLPGLAGVEERVVLFRARDGQSAIRKARREGERYCADLRYENVYGQQVLTELLAYAEAYELENDPGDGTEVFSAIEIIDSREAQASILSRKVGREAGRETARMFIEGTLTRSLDDQKGRS